MSTNINKNTYTNTGFKKNTNPPAQLLSLKPHWNILNATKQIANIDII